MSRMKALKTDDELSAVPITQPVLVELPGGFEPLSNGLDDDPDKSSTQADDGSKRLQDDYEALKAQGEQQRLRAEQAERDAADARRQAKEREDENARLRAGREQDEGVLIANGLSGAQSERDAAKQAFKHAYDAGDPDAMAEAQSRIGRAEAKILGYESGAAEIEQRKTETRREPERQSQTPVVQDFVTAVNSNHNLLPAEREWMIRNQSKFNDPDFNKELDVAYTRAVKKEGLTRGTPAYFDYIEKFTGIKKAESNDDDERDTSVSAPPSRNERGGDGRPTNGKIMLSPEQREIAKSMGVTDIEYARQVATFDVARKSDPEKYR